MSIDEKQSNFPTSRYTTHTSLLLHHNRRIIIVQEKECQIININGSTLPVKINYSVSCGLGDINIINHLDIISMARVKSKTIVSKAALMDIRTPCLILEGSKGEVTDRYIVTPWDVVMKTLKSENKPIIAN